MSAASSSAVVDGRGPPGVDDGPGDAAGLGLLAEAPEEGGQLVLVEGREQLRGGHAATRVEAHVERAAGTEAEAAVRVGQLEAAQAEVEERAVDLAEAGRRRDVRELAEVRLAQDEAIPEPGLETTGHSGDGRPIGVETEEAAIRVGRLQDPLGVPTAAEGGVDLEASRGRREHRHDLHRQHRDVPYLHLSSTVRRSDPERTLEAHVVRARSPGPRRPGPAPAGRRVPGRRPTRSTGPRSRRGRGSRRRRRRRRA